MNINLPYILQNGMKILNIVNKTLPLVKEFNPAAKYITKKLKSANLNALSVPKNVQNKNTAYNSTLPNKSSVNNNFSINPNNNSLTFFR